MTFEIQHIFPFLMAILSAIAAVVYGYKLQGWGCFYYVCAAGINVCAMVKL